MKKFFKLFDKSPKQKDSIDREKPNWNSWFQEKATVLYPPASLSIGELLSASKDAYAHYFKITEPEESNTDQAIVFSAHPKGKLKSLINLNVTYQLYVQPQKQYWSFALGVKPDPEDEGIPQDIPGLATVSQRSLMHKIEDAWQAMLPEKISLEESARNPKASYLPAAGHFVEKPKAKAQLWQHSFFPETESLLMWLSISAMKEAPEEIDLSLYRKHEWHYWATEKRCGLTAFATNNKAVVFELTESDLNAKDVIGRDHISQGGWAWLATLKNEALYQESQAFINAGGVEERMRECARLNWLLEAKDQESNDYAFALMRRLASFSTNPLDDLALFFMSITDTKRQVIINQDNTDEDLLNEIQKALTKTANKEALPQWVESWNIPPESASSLLSAFLSLRKGESKHLLPLHWWVREQFLAKQPQLKPYDKWEKPLINRLNFEFEYLQHLLSANSHQEALTLAQELFASLPPETSQDLIPELSLEDEDRKQTYRIQLLDFIAQAKQNDTSQLIELTQLARLEPLRLPRLQALKAAANSPLKERVQECIEVISEKEFILDKYSSKKYPTEPLPTESVEHIQSLMNSDLVSKVQSWLATVKAPDINQVRSYNEQITGQNDPAYLLTKVISIQRVLKMTPIDCYLTRGDKAGEIRGHAGANPFLMIGHDLVDKESPRELGDSELLFLLATEMAHIKFKHAKITSQDVWRGSLEKGVLAAQFLPMLGGAFKALSIPVAKVPISPILEKGSSTLQQLGNTGLFEYAKSHWDSYLDSDSVPENRDDAMLEMSRLMQFVADRIGLVVCGNIKAAVRGMFHASDAAFKNVPFVGMYGIKSLAEQENDEGRLAYEQLTLRIASLMSFYLTQEYEDARHSIIKPISKK